MRLDHVSVRYRVPRERVSGLKEFAIRWLQRKMKFESFWALTEASFEVNRGEVFGVIGRNGSGKSTMLKVMARVLTPTRGRIITRGRVAPLLELGAGFHPELTGRENVFLNCALLGNTQKETEQLLPGIVEFSELSDFIDAPLRTYSTGMVARLGFSVATAVRPDILLVDEVLSVGDTAFQEKCINRMNGFLDKGTTIIIVSHSLPTIHSFCHRALWLDKGEVKYIGGVDAAIQEYAKTF